MTRVVDPEWVRLETVKALASDDTLMELLVLKGGVALRVGHGVGSRGSFDIDYSTAKSVDAPDELRVQIEHALKEHFAANGCVVFDVGLERRPPKPMKRNGVIIEGYSVSFKVISQELHDKLGGEIEALRRQAVGIRGARSAGLPYDPQARRVFEIEISTNEYCDAKEIVNVDDVQVYAYSVSMILAEKLRALCQQMPEYPNPYPRARARDFYDIFAIVRKHPDVLRSAELESHLRGAFAAKGVPLSLIGKIPTTAAFHADDWGAVKNELGGIDAGVEFEDVVRHVADVVETLEPLWHE